MVNRYWKQALTVLVLGAFVIMGLSSLALAQKSLELKDAAKEKTIFVSVQGAGSPIGAATVTLYAAGEGKPVQLAQGKTDANGAFKLKVKQVPKDSVLYLISKGGEPKAGGSKGPNPAIALMATLGTTPPKRVTINELTTVASVWTGAQFLNGTAFSGNALGLRIAAGNVSNLVDLETGGLGPVI
jgi:hypothetical protein